MLRVAEGEEEEVVLMLALGVFFVVAEGLKVFKQEGEGVVL